MASRIYTRFLVVIALVALLGCGPRPVDDGNGEPAHPAIAPAGAPEPEAAWTPRPFDEVPPTPVPWLTAEEGWRFPGEEELAHLDSYRLVSQVTYRVAGTSGAMTTTIDVTGSPPRRHTTTETHSGEGAAEERHRAEIVEVDGMTHLKVDDDGWVSYPSDPSLYGLRSEWLGGFDDALTACQALPSGPDIISLPTRAGEQTAEVLRYTIDGVCLAENAGLSDTAATEGTLWTSPALGLVVQVIFQQQGADEEGQPILYRLRAALVDVNAPIAIEVP